MNSIKQTFNKFTSLVLE